jgi:type I restriction enzyme S subunit
MVSEIIDNFKKLPDGWKTASLKDITLKIGSGSTPRGGESAYISDRLNFAFIRSQNIYDFEFSSEGIKFISDKDADKLKGVHLQREDILLNITGDGITFARCCMVPEYILPAAVNQHVSIIRLDQSKCLPNYLLAYLCLPKVKLYIESFNAGGSRRAITKGHIESFEIPLPPMDVQEQVSINVRDIIAKQKLNHGTNQTLEQMAQTLFKSWFVDFDPVFDNALLKAGIPTQKSSSNEQDQQLLASFPEALRPKAKLRLSALRRKKDQGIPTQELGNEAFPSEFEFKEKLGWIPMGWGTSNVGKEFDVTMGQSPPGSTYNESNEGIPFFQGKTDFGFRFPSNRIYCTAPKRLAKKNDTLVSVRAPVGTINLAKHFEVFEGEGTVFGSINQNDLKGLPQLDIPTELVSVFNEYSESWDQKIELASSQINELTKLRDTLLPKLISGELQIPVAEPLVKEMA